jgi:phage terminase large subunit GpA-like protein
MYINNIIDDKYGEYNPETAAYHCPKCNTVWGDRQKNINLQQALQWHDLGWKKKYPEREDIGFCFTELMSIFASSTFVNLAKKQLAAEWAFHHGKEEELIVFVNNSKGEAYENKATSLVESDLQKKALSYAEQKVVKDGLMLTMGIDVQHNRFAYAVRAWGDNGVSWLVHYTEVFGNVLNTKDKVWGHLASVCKKPYYWLGKTDVQLRPSAISIDASDGMTTEAVYGFVKVLNSEGVNIMAVKGSSETYTEQEIFTVPKNRLTTVVGKVKSLAETMGVVIYPVGTNRAKDFILRQLQNESVNDRMHYYSTVLPTYYKQLLSNSKRIVGTRVRYFKKYGHQDEALDCEVYALHAARSLFIHLRTSEEWTRHKEILLADLSDTIMEIAPAKITGKASRIKDTFD